MYDANLTYEENYLNGPFSMLTKEKKFPKIKYIGKPKFEFLGIPLSIPFGVPAGPLLNSKFIKVALDAGFCLPTYKTVRSSSWKCNDWPNILSIKSNEEYLFADTQNKVQALHIKNEDYFKENISISNSFGVPSRNYEEWNHDFNSLSTYNTIPGVHISLSFQASSFNMNSQKQVKNLFLEDAQKICELASNTVTQTGFSLLEINLSCPNEKHLPIYKDLPSAIKLLSSVREVLKNHKRVKLIAKIGAMTSEEVIQFLSEAGHCIDAVSAINTISADILTAEGASALGNQSLSGGVCGKLILEQGLQIAERIAQTREKLGIKKQDLGLIGVGGVTNVNNFKSYLNAGVDLVQSATGMMWNLNLAQEIATHLKVNFEHNVE